MTTLLLAAGLWLLLGAAFDMKWERRVVAVAGALILWWLVR